jgi:hypothetical protein
MIYILPYKPKSRGARALARALGGSILKGAAAPTDIVINWGNTKEYDRATVNGTDIRSATNKKVFLRNMQGDGKAHEVPPFWCRREEIPADAYPIVCRTTLAGHSGDGIVIANGPNELVDAPLYVKYIKKTDEYRVHVGKKGDDVSIIAVQRKARRYDHENPNWQVRSHANGFVYARQNVNPPKGILDLACSALRTSGLDFGAVDIIYNGKEDRAYVLEINTAPGLQGQTVQDYASFFRTA